MRLWLAKSRKELYTGEGNGVAHKMNMQEGPYSGTTGFRNRNPELPFRT